MTLYLTDENGLGSCFGAALITFALRIDFVKYKTRRERKVAKEQKGYSSQRGYSREWPLAPEIKGPKKHNHHTVAWVIKCYLAIIVARVSLRARPPQIGEKVGSELYRPGCVLYVGCYRRETLGVSASLRVRPPSNWRKSRL